MYVTQNRECLQLVTNFHMQGPEVVKRRKSARSVSVLHRFEAAVFGERQPWTNSTSGVLHENGLACAIAHSCPSLNVSSEVYQRQYCK